MKLMEAEKKAQDRDKRLYKTYGITSVEYDMLLDQQKGVCEICKTLPPSGRLNVDHMHVKGFKNMTPIERKKYVRGLLCFLCNTLVGKLERTNNVEINRLRMFNVQKYFTRYKMKGES